jgi:DNA mismatch repair protein MutS
VRGGADDSYGIEVSKLAGVPQWVIARARKVLEDLESAQPVRSAQLAGRKIAVDAEDIQISFGQMHRSEVEDKLRETDLNTLSPYEAQQLLFELKKLAGE